MPSPTVPLSVENEAIAGVTGALVSMVTLSAARGRAGIAGHIGGGGGQAVGAVGQRGRGVAPGPAAVGGGGAQQRGAVIDLDRGIGFRGAGQRQGIVIGDAVANRAAVGRERGDRSGRPAPLVSMVTLSAAEAALVLPAASVAVAVRLWAPLASAAVVIAPGAAAVGGGGAQQRGAVIDLDRGIGFRAAGQRQGIVIGDAVADRAAVGRERGNRSGRPAPRCRW